MLLRAECDSSYDKKALARWCNAAFVSYFRPLQQAHGAVQGAIGEAQAFLASDA